MTATPVGVPGVAAAFFVANDALLALQILLAAGSVQLI
jgi:hypothetical protein